MTAVLGMTREDIEALARADIPRPELSEGATVLLVPMSPAAALDMMGCMGIETLGVIPGSVIMGEYVTDDGAYATDARPVMAH